MTIFQLSTIFLKNYVQRRLKPSTIRGYTVNLNKHILPFLADREVENLTVDDLDELTDDLMSKGLSNKSIVYVHATFRKMYSYAVKRSYVEYSPYSAYDLPRVEKYRHTVISSDDMARLLDLARGTDLYIPIMLALKYGLRRGEILGIMPKADIDYSSRVLHIQRTKGIENGKVIITSCKTSNSDRRILVSENDIVSLLPFSDRDFLTDISPNMVDKRFKKFIRINGFPDIRFHDLRHSYATYMLSQGVNPKIVSQVLGHSGISITLDLYSHPDVSMQNVCLRALQFI